MTALVDAGAQANIATFAWQGAARLATTANQNGTGTDYVYDGFRRVASIDHTLSGGGNLHKFEYAYDKVHNRRMEKNTFSASWIGTLPTAVQTFLNGRNGKGDVYAYDMAYRLVDARYDVTSPLTEVQNPGTQAFVTNVAYTIDGLGNRSQVSTTPPTPPTQVLYANDVVNQYTTVGGTGRTHDNNGNLSDDGTYKFGYDFENRLAELRSSATNAVIASYRFDALGRRTEKAVAGGATTRYLFDGAEVVEEYDGSNAWRARYVYEDGIDHPRCMDRADIADVNGNSNTTEVLRFHYHQQAVGNVTEMTQPTGAVVEWTTYDVYGLPTVRDRSGTIATQSPIGNPFLFTGRHYDPESGSYFYRARQYDPGTGRFLQRDPSGPVDGLGLHEYTRSSPAVRVDHDGRDSTEERETTTETIDKPNYTQHIIRHRTITTHDPTYTEWKTIFHWRFTIGLMWIDITIDERKATQMRHIHEIKVVTTQPKTGRFAEAIKKWRQDHTIFSSDIAIAADLAAAAGGIALEKYSSTLAVRQYPAGTILNGKNVGGKFMPRQAAMRATQVAGRAIVVAAVAMAVAGVIEHGILDDIESDLQDLYNEYSKVMGPHVTETEWDEKKEWKEYRVTIKIGFLLPAWVIGDFDFEFSLEPFSDWEPHGKRRKVK